jgi:hypothetical protein
MGVRGGYVLLFVRKRTDESIPVGKVEDLADRKRTIHQQYSRIILLARELIHSVVSVSEQCSSLATSSCARTGSCGLPIARVTPQSCNNCGLLVSTHIWLHDLASIVGFLCPLVLGSTILHPLQAFGAGLYLAPPSRIHCGLFVPASSWITSPRPPSMSSMSLASSVI